MKIFNLKIFSKPINVVISRHITGTATTTTTATGQGIIIFIPFCFVFIFSAFQSVFT